MPEAITADLLYHTGIQLAANAAELLVFSVSRQSRSKESPLRQLRWPDPQGGSYLPLELDSQTVQDYRAALDTINCVVSS